MTSRSIKLFGTDEPPVETRLLRAGPLSVELDGGNLRYIRYDGHEAIRAVSYVARDQYWGTFNAEIENLEVEETAEGFTVTYDAECKDATQSFRYAAKITGSADGTLRFEGAGSPVTNFLTNRTGFVVLHPVAGVSGFPAEVEHVDGRVVTTDFPARIDPKQPIMDIRAITHEVCPGLKVTCTMEGDSFEMEDQRNWTDASYKTYVRPLGLPFPYTLMSGEGIEQSVTVRFSGAPQAAQGVAQGADQGPDRGASGPAPVSIRVGGREGRVPEFAMAIEPRDTAAALEIDAVAGIALTALAPRFLSCYLDLRNDGDAGPALAGFQELGAKLGTELALEIIAPSVADAGPALHKIAAQAKAAGAEAASVAVTHAGDLAFVMPGTLFPDSADFDALYGAARAAFPEARLGGGNFIFFTELNRKPPPVEQLDFVCHTTSAIVHAADDRSITETIECLPYLVQSFRALFGDTAYRVGPSGIGSRANPFGADSPPNSDLARVTMTRADPRQRGLLGAAWHLGYAARMAEGGVDQVILGSPVGDYGLIHHGPASVAPDYDGAVYPTYHVMRGMYQASGAARRATESSAPRDVQALAYEPNGGETDGGVTLWLANLTGEPQRVEIAGLAGTDARLSLLDEDSFATCVAGPDGFEGNAGTGSAAGLTLAPYAVARLEVDA
ncbi:MAG: D-apionate lactonase [Alphaproteobacteria bacterium]